VFADFDLLWGGYVGLDADYKISEHWGVSGGVQFQDLGNYNHSFGGREVNLDLSRSLFFLVGISYNF
jgi:outer membrane scaffolding protein for murein synthesis (MipA/OmpV family)